MRHINTKPNINCGESMKRTDQAINMEWLISLEARTVKPVGLHITVTISPMLNTAVPFRSSLIDSPRSNDSYLDASKSRMAQQNSVLSDVASDRLTLINKIGQRVSGIITSFL